MVSSSNNHSANSFLQAIEKPGPKDYIQHSTRPMNGINQPNPDPFKMSLANLGVKPPTYDEPIPNVLANIEHFRSFYNGQDQAGTVRSNYSSIEILCQIFPGRSRISLENLLKVCVLLKTTKKYD